ncbi:M61 family metallopeptidase [Moraxella sp.]|uniref:M61 family metallopeptidase n=1 Tax=Moraxella sp. TaxID=479 RepID=UPI0026DD67AC|nr:PDZ domain-containing protein [Moraxella sp.]MDO4895487.1 M61 family peptidase [Moraxella sp.]
MNYLINFQRFYEHLADVECQFIAPTDAPKLWMPTWIAGSYMIREFSKHITAVYYQIGQQTFKADKTNKNTFELTHAKRGDDIRVYYEVYCYDLSVRTAFIDHTRIFGNFSSLLLFLENHHKDTANLQLSVPQSFLSQNPDTLIACGLPHQSKQTDEGITYTLPALPAFDYTDYPFEIGTQVQFEFAPNNQGKNIRHRFFLAGRHHANLSRLQADLQKICQTYITWLGDVPFDDYTFMTMVTGSDYGGLEHLNSTALVSPRTDMPAMNEPQIPSADYQRFLGLCSHEYFHAWWVKSVRPDVMMDNDLQQEGYTPLLWVFEGFTSYIDDLMLLASGVIDKSSYLKLLAAQINRHEQTDGRHHQSVAESSFDTWIKLYRPDENSSNQSVSYYNKGALVALLLDLTLLEQSAGKYRLFDVIKTFYDKAKNAGGFFGMTTQIMGEVVSSMIGQEAWQSFYADYVIGTAPLPIADMLAKVHITTDISTTAKPWGMSIDENKFGIKIKQLHRDSAGSLAGLSANDIIIAIDGIKASQAVLSHAITRQNHDKKAITVHAFRRDELMTFYVAHKPTQHQQVKLSGDGGAWLKFAF